MEWEGKPGDRFPGICLMIEENLRKPSGALSSVIGHFFKWAFFHPNEVDRVILPAPLAKPIQVCQRSILKIEI